MRQTGQHHPPLEGNVGADRLDSVPPPARRKRKGKGPPAFGLYVRRLREGKGWSRKQFAELLRVHPSHVSGIENGYWPGGAGWLLDRLCQLFPAHQDELRRLRAQWSPQSNSAVTEHALVGTTQKRPSKVHRADPSQLEGTWYLYWQTCAHGQGLRIAERVLIAPSIEGRFEMHNGPTYDGDRAVEPPEHSFPWRATCSINVEHWISGEFRATDTALRVDGSFRLKLDRFSKTMIGVWMGVSWESEQTFGILALGRSREDAQHQYEAKTAANPILPLVVQ